MKYDKIVEISREKSREKAKIAIKAIQEIISRRERITVSELTRRTGLSKEIFYSNREVREVLENAKLKQDTAYNPDIVIMDKNMEDKIIHMKIELIKLRVENDELKALNNDLIEQNRNLIQENRQKNQ